MARPPEPEEIYERSQEEGRRRLSRHPLELAATAVVGGFDIAFGVTALGVVTALVASGGNDDLAHLAGALAFSIGFVFVVVGRSELFTENFLVPVAGLDRSDRTSWLKLAELWAATPVLNIVGGCALVVVLSVHGVLPPGTGDALSDVGETVAGFDALTALVSAVAAGALMTLMTWLVEGADTAGVRVAVAAIIGTLIAAASFNHAVVATIELFFAKRFDADVAWSDMAANLGLSVAGNLVGGVLFVTIARYGQALGARAGR